MTAPQPHDQTGSAEPGPPDWAPDAAEIDARCTSLEHERDALRRLLNLQERERQLVAFDIHDGLAQYVTGALMHLQAYQRDGGQPPTPDGIAEAVRLLRAAAAEARRLIGNLRPAAFDGRNLVQAVESLVGEVRGDGPAVEFGHTITGEPIPPALEIAIYRIVQEALANARRHARAGRVRVRLERVPRGVCLSVSDDGRGFDPASVPVGRFGLEGIRHRAHLFGAEPHIQSAAGQGTSIRIEFPLER